MEQSTQSSSPAHWLLGGALLLIAVVVVIALVMINSQAVNISTTTQINNVLPTVDTIGVATGAGINIDNTGGPGGTLSLTSGTDTYFNVNGVISDLNGDADVSSAVAVLYHGSTPLQLGCNPDKNDCYRPTCTLNAAYGTATQVSYTCDVNIAFFADSTSTGGAFPAEIWTVRVDASDEVGSGSLTTTKEVGTLLALNIPNAINYGTRPLGTTTLAVENQHQSIEQYGNDEADVEVSSAAPMTCSVRGAIPVANQRWSLTDVEYGSGLAVALTGAAVDTALAVGYRTDEVTPLTKTLYWNIAIPAAGVEGACTGTTVETAIAA